MKSKIGYSVILAIIMGISISNASADHSKVDVNIIEGSAVPGCEEKNECYIPYNIIVDAGGEVIWNNNDNAAHTITSGTPNDGPDGLFDSSLFTAGSTFSVIFDDSFKTGNYHYFCMVHPWMEGIVSVEEETDYLIVVYSPQVQHFLSFLMIVSKQVIIIIFVWYIHGWKELLVWKKK